MNALRESLVSIPGALSNLISDRQLHRTTSTSTSTLTPTLNSTDEASGSQTSQSYCDKSLPIPASLVKEQWRLIFTSDANTRDLEAAIAHCKDLVLLTDECSDERRWLVRHLVDLRYSLKELRDAETDPCESGPSVKTVVGHHFVTHRPGGRLQTAATRYYCDHCTGIIWSVVQNSYICSDCQYLVHQKCIDNVIRVCAHVIATERQYPIMEICPEIGLAAQEYKCAECGTLLNFKSSWIEPCLCDYSGLYYCPSCHWNDTSIIPARVVHNWDFAPRRVSRSSLQEIQLFLDKPVIKLEEVNPKLFVFLEKLCTLRKLRQNLVYMRKYLLECRLASDERLLDTQIGAHRHLIQSTDYYTVNDLEQTELGTLIDCLNKVFSTLEQHIRKCAMCTAKAYICEICSNDEVLFPFDDGCIICDKCNSIFHRVCMTRKNMICTKCVRVQTRRSQLEADAECSERDH